jgi:4-amino-4-deoxy-L-arabinose transferase-like glycosyltransferase
MTPRDTIFVGDKLIALGSILLFLASVVVLFFIARRLFDQKLAGLSCALVLLCDTFWQYSLSGLPQMLLLLLFNLTIYAFVRAIEEKTAGRPAQRWLGCVGAGFGLLALSHALTIWIFVPAFIFTVLYFRPRLRTAIWLLAPFALLYGPWLLRNYLVCGNPAGVAYYSFFDQIGMSEAGHMRRPGIDFAALSMGVFRNKVGSNFIDQIGHIFHYFGWCVVALFYFAALLHPFRRTVTATLRWLLLALWAGAVLGMAVYGMPEEQEVVANQLHLLFVPIMTCFGLAFLLVLWNRLEIRNRLARVGFLTLLFLLCSWPMVFNLCFAKTKSSVRWPPYVPPYIAVIHDWMKPDEIVATDMPWAVAWYADRRAVWLPETIRAFTEMSDYEFLGGKINGLYMTSISGSGNTMRDILKGEYKDWAPVILRSIDMQKFPLKWGTMLGLEEECTFFSDYDRQKPNAGRP